MRSTRLVVSGCLVLLVATIPTAAATLVGGGVAAGDPCANTLCAGAAALDATWHVGSGSGQYAGNGPGPVVDATSQNDGQGVDPDTHATIQNPSYGIETRDSVRALVVGNGQQRWALVTNDLYIPQELLNARVASLLQQYDLTHPDAPTGIDASNLTVSVSHNHASPYYSSTGWGVWTFQDVIDIRFFEWMAETMANAVVQASQTIVPARVGAATTELTLSKANPEGPSIAQDGTPAAFPDSDTDPTLTVVRFDRADTGGLLANWFVYGRHPEGLSTKGLLSAEYVNDTYRIVEREMGGVTLFSQRDVGTGEVTNNAEAHTPQSRQEWDSHDFANRQRVARLFATRVEALSQAVAAGAPGDYTVRGESVGVDQVVPPSSGASVAVDDRRFAPPGVRPSPTVSNCRTEQAFMGNPELPVVGLPDCEGPQNQFGTGTPDFSQVVDYYTLRDAGVPVPDNYGAPSYTGLQESVAVHLQAIRLGDIAITVCPCEEWSDLDRNIVSRLDRTADDFYYGWDWTANYLFDSQSFSPGVAYDGGSSDDGRAHGPLELALDPQYGGGFWCLPYQGDQAIAGFDGTAASAAGADSWHCRDPHGWQPWFGGPSATYSLTVTDTAFRRWKARIYNKADGWDAPENGVAAESEPTDPEAIWGNWTHEELAPANGYELVIPMSMGNEYWGYMPEFREYQARDFYRKALEGLGPHGADFLATRLTRMAASIYRGGLPDVPVTAKDDAYQADVAAETVRANALGQAAATYLPAYEAQLPADGGAPAVSSQPSAKVSRFSPATITWVGGSNYTDVPHVRVERRGADGSWTPYGDTRGDVQMMVDFPNPDELPAYRAGQYAWHWTANFETYDSDVALPDASGRVHSASNGRGSQVPNGTYRFVIDGCFRSALPTTTPGDGGAPCHSYDPTGRVSTYHLVSKPFVVGPWTGITVADPHLSGANRTLTFSLGPAYAEVPSASNSDLTSFTDAAGSLSGTSRSYTIGLFDYGEGAADPVDYPNWYSPAFPYLTPGKSTDTAHRYEVRTYRGTDTEAFCFLCSFEPWADTGAVDAVTVTVVRNGSGTVESVAATYDPTTGTWSAPVELRPFDRAYVAAGAVHDGFGETNGAPSETVVAPPPQP